MIAVLGETTAGPFLPRLRNQMLASPSGRDILRERPRITSTTVDMAALRKLPDGSFGRAYADWLEWCKVTPDTRDPVCSLILFNIAIVEKSAGPLHRRPRASLRHATLPRMPRLLSCHLWSLPSVRRRRTRRQVVRARQFWSTRRWHLGRLWSFAFVGAGQTETVENVRTVGAQVRVSSEASHRCLLGEGVGDAVGRAQGEDGHLGAADVRRPLLSEA